MEVKNPIKCLLLPPLLRPAPHRLVSACSGSTMCLRAQRLELNAMVQCNTSWAFPANLAPGKHTTAHRGPGASPSLHMQKVGWPKQACPAAIAGLAGAPSEKQEEQAIRTQAFFLL